MVMMLPTVSLILAGGLALLNIWLGFRVGQVRGSEKVSVGDGGNERVIRRMRAHANFAENAPIVLALVLILELSVGTSSWLWGAAGTFLIARVLHGLGMDGWRPGRAAGTVATFAIELALAIWAIAVPLVAQTARVDAPVEMAPARG